MTPKQKYHKEWAAKNKDKVKAAQERYKAKHPDKVKAVRKAWRNKNRDKFNAARRKWRALNKEKASAQTRAWFAKERETKEGQIKRMLRTASRSQKIFAITAEDVLAVWPADDCCPVTRIPFAYGVQAKKNSATPSLDRVDSSKGYVVGNIAVISWRANEMKRDYTKAEIIALADWIKEFS